MNATSHCLSAAFAAILFFSSPAFAEQRFIVSSARELPISASVDVLVVGGNEGGAAAAWEAARGGASAMVLTENYFLSDDVSAKARYWLEDDEIPRGQFARALFGADDGKESALPTPWQYKMRIEDLLREAGVAYQYNTRPIAALCDASGDIAGVAVANKAGVQAIRAKVVVDCTSTGTVARMMGAEAAPWPAGRVTVSRIAYQKDVPGSKRFGDFYEYALEVRMPTGSWPERCKDEVLLRETYNAVRGNKAHAQRMHLIEPAAIRTDSLLNGSDRPEPAEMDLDVFRPAGLKHLYLVSQAAGVPRSLAAKLTRPVHLANLGQRIGTSVLQEAAERTDPDGVAVFTNEQAEGLADVEVHELLFGHRRWTRNALGAVSQPEVPIPVWGEYDIIVAGGGVAGKAAALAAGRAEARVLLVEMLGQLGGNQTLGTPGYWRGYRHGVNQDPPTFEKLRKADVDIWYNTLACGALKKGNQVVGLTVATRMGRGAVLGKVTIDDL